jgi:hypothetical protein
MGFLGCVLWVFRRVSWVTVPFFADLLEFASNIGEEDDEEEKPRRPLALAGCGKKVMSLVVTRPDVVLGGQISSGRERKSLKREEGEVEEPLVPFIGARPPMPWVRRDPRVGLSRPQQPDDGSFFD